MSKFMIDSNFWELFPNAQIGVVVARGINNSSSLPDSIRQEIKTELAKAEAGVQKYLTAPVFSDNPEIQVWRSAFQKFKTKKGARSSIEALLKRAQKGTGIPSINPLVDIYNTVSLSYGLPCGGEDIDQFKGDLKLTVAQGGEDFLALGDTSPDPALPGEVIYRDEEGAVCRCWNWRDGQRTMLTGKTVNAFLVLESVDPDNHSTLAEAVSQLANLTRRMLNGNVESWILDKDSAVLIEMSDDTMVSG